MPRGRRFLMVPAAGYRQFKRLAAEMAGSSGKVCLHGCADYPQPVGAGGSRLDAHPWSVCYGGRRVFANGQLTESLARACRSGR